MSEQNSTTEQVENCARLQHAIDEMLQFDGHHEEMFYIPLGGGRPIPETEMSEILGTSRSPGGNNEN